MSCKLTSLNGGTLFLPILFHPRNSSPFESCSAAKRDIDYSSFTYFVLSQLMNRDIPLYKHPPNIHFTYAVGGAVDKNIYTRTNEATRRDAKWMKVLEGTRSGTACLKHHFLEQLKHPHATLSFVHAIKRLQVVLWVSPCLFSLCPEGAN